MQERLKQIPVKLLEMWNKYTSKQKTIIISVVSGVIVLMALLVVILGRTKYTVLSTFENATVAAGVVKLLDENMIPNRLLGDRCTVEVDETRQTDAIVLITQSDLQDTGFTIDDLLATSISTTNSERVTRTHLLMQSDLKKDIESMEGVESARVNYVPVDTTSSILNEQKNIRASVMLRVNDDFNKYKTPEAIAYLVAYALGNTSTEDIKIIDQYGNLLYNGPDDEETMNEEEAIMYREKLADNYSNLVYRGFLMNDFDLVEVMPHLDVNMNKMTEYVKTYIPAEGGEQGYFATQSTYSASGTGVDGDVPGTDSNDETDYYMTDGTGGNYNVDSFDATYVLGERIVNTVYSSGTVNAENSSISVVATRLIERTEAELELLGLLEELTYEEYKLLNSAPVKLAVDEDWVKMVAYNTGIAEDNIHITAYEQFSFIDTVEEPLNWTLILEIALAVLLLAFLLYVVFRGMAPVEVTEMEPELSVEQLLATTKENQTLEEVEFSERSETRIMIEKFFEENPEAVALLLRNWLNEDWE